MHRIYLLSVGRQAGKTAFVRALIGWALTALALPASWSTILGLAHDRGQARIPYQAVAADLHPLARRLGPAPRGGLSITRYLGIRSGIGGRHREYTIASRDARAAIRGMSTDLDLFDEVRTQHDDETWSALLPTVAARPEPLIVLTSTAGDVRSILLRDLFDRGLRIIAGAEPAEGFGMTWYAADDDDDPADPRAWRKSTPALVDGRLSDAVIRAELYGLKPAAFRSERLNLWVDDLADSWLPAGTWAAREMPQPELVPGSVALAVEAVPTWRRASIVVAGRLADGDIWAGVVGDLDASSSVAATIPPRDLGPALDAAAATWSPSVVVYSAAAAAAPHVAAWAAEADIEALALTGGQLRAASELTRGELVGGRLWHPADPLLAHQTRLARPSGPIEAGAWFLSIKRSLGEVDAIRALAWATYGVIRPDKPEGSNLYIPGD